MFGKLYDDTTKVIGEYNTYYRHKRKHQWVRKGGRHHIYPYKLTCQHQQQKGKQK